MPHALLLAILLALAGCSANRPWNPAFPISPAEAQADLRTLTAEPQLFDRPVIISGGYADTGLFTSTLVNRIRKLTTDRDQVLAVRYLGTSTFDECADRLIDAIDERYGRDSPTDTIEVDVIGFSMGGLIARHAAQPERVSGRRLRIRRLFTISTPHRGAQLACISSIDRRTADMRTGSKRLELLDIAFASADYELIPYGRRNDLIVGDIARMAPPGRTPWWVQPIPFTLPHSMAHHDPRILADIARRLRGMPPHTIEQAISNPRSDAPDDQSDGWSGI